MARPLLVAALLLVASAAAAFVTSCNASTTEGCLAGPCTGAGGSSGAATGAGTGGAGTTSGSGGAGAASACPPVAQVGDFPCDVFKVVHHRCNPCHQKPPLNNAPFPLLTYADTQVVYVPGELRFQQMYLQVQPGASPRMPFGGMLTDSEFGTLTGWLAQCAPPVPAGTGCGCPGNGCD